MAYKEDAIAMVLRKPKFKIKMEKGIKSSKKSILLLYYL